MTNRLLFLAAALLAAAAPSFAIPITCRFHNYSCGCGWLHKYKPDGTTVLTNISIATSTESGSAPAGAIDPTQVAITFSNVGNLLNVTLTNLTPSNWALTGTQQFDLFFIYTVTGVGFPNYLTGVGDSFTGSGTSTGFIAFDKTADGVTLNTLTLASMTQAAVGFPAAPLSTYDVSDHIQVRATGGTAALTSATNSFTTTPSSVPEPATSLLLASGLLAFGYALRRSDRISHRLPKPNSAYGNSNSEFTSLFSCTD